MASKKIFYTILLLFIFQLVSVSFAQKFGEQFQQASGQQQNADQDASDPNQTKEFDINDYSQTEYYSVVEDIMEGRDLYKVLQLENDPENPLSQKQIRKAFRNLSLTLHPDKLPEDQLEEGTKKYMIVTHAMEILGTPRMRLLYDHLLKNGIKWEHRYYGRWAHRYGASHIPLAYVAIAFFVSISIIQYISQHMKYRRVHRLVRGTTRFKTAANQYSKTSLSGSKGGLSGSNGGEDSDEEETPDSEEVGAEPKVEIQGLKEPTVIDTLLVQTYLVPWGIVLLIYWGISWIYKYKILGEAPETWQERVMRENNMTQEELDAAIAKQEARVQRIKESSKYKKYKRMMKKMATKSR